MKQIKYLILSFISSLLICNLSFADTIQFKDNFPESYVVRKGDTLWDIAGKFLKNPWQWRQVWNDNPQIKNPHRIYPGDVIYASYINGRASLMTKRNATVKLTPQVRASAIEQAIPTIPLHEINSFLTKNRLLSSENEFYNNPYVLAGETGRVISGFGDKIFARGAFYSDNKQYGIFRLGKRYIDPVSSQVIALNADEIGSATLEAVEDTRVVENTLGEMVRTQTATLILNRASTEIKPTDRLLSYEQEAQAAFFEPSEPKQAITNAYIIDIPKGVHNVGQRDVVVINKGFNQGLENGNILSIYKQGEMVRDRVNEDIVRVPSEKAGLLMIFRTYSNISYGIVLSATKQLSIMDSLHNPQ